MQPSVLLSARTQRKRQRFEDPEEAAWLSEFLASSTAPQIPLHLPPDQSQDVNPPVSTPFLVPSPQAGYDEDAPGSLRTLWKTVEAFEKSLALPTPQTMEPLLDEDCDPFTFTEDASDVDDALDPPESQSDAGLFL